MVAFPTETVYGLGADAANPDAVAKIFRAKGRPATNPLIVHVADESVARRYAGDWPDAAKKLAARFWPGPLTIVVRRGQSIVDAVTAGGPTVGLRVPDHPVALQLLSAFDGPVAAPSANRSEHVSPTLASHVTDDLGDRVDLILDGGPCGVGIESTVVDVTAGSIRLLRPGSITAGQLEEVVGPIRIGRGEQGGPAASPGQHLRHYAPRTPAFRFDPQLRAAVIARAAVNRGLVWSFFDVAGVDHVPDDPGRFARELYQRLRKADLSGWSAIYIEMPPATPAWAGVRDRLMRATSEFNPHA